MYAAREGRVTVCEKLLQHGAEVNKQDMRGWTVSCLEAVFRYARFVFLKILVLCSQHLKISEVVRPKSLINTTKQDDKHPHHVPRA